MLVRARKQEFLVRKIKIAAVGIRHRREKTPVSNRSCLLEVPEDWSSLCFTLLLLLLTLIRSKQGL